MLKLLNRYSQGLVFVPMIAAWRRNFAAMDRAILDLFERESPDAQPQDPTDLPAHASGTDRGTAGTRLDQNDAGAVTARASREAERDFGDFAFTYAVAQLQALGVMSVVGESCQVDEIRRNLPVIPKYHRFFDAFLQHVVARNLARMDGDRVAPTPELMERSANLAGLDDFVAQLLERFPDYRPLCALATRSLQRFADIIRGRVSVLEIVFPNGDVELFEKVFADRSLAGHFNDVVVRELEQCVAELATQANPTARQATCPRVLEVGVASGGLTAATLPGLSRCCNSYSYCATDVSRAFLRRISAKFSEHYPGFWTHLLDLDDSRVIEAIGVGSQDVIVAGHVLHNTQDVVASLRLLRSLLAPGGKLIHADFTAFKSSLFFSGGLLTGTWRFEDPEKRLPHSCLLNVAQWRSVLAQAGFEDVRVIGAPGESCEEDMDECVIVARAAATDISCTTDLTPARTTVAARAVQPANAAEAAGGALHEPVKRALFTILGEERSGGYASDVPLKEFGLDSMEFVELKGLIGSAFGITLPPTFLFEHSTVDRIVGALKELIPRGSEHTSPANEAETVDRSVSVVHRKLPAEEVGAFERLPGVRRPSDSGHAPEGALTTRVPRATADERSVAIVGMAFRLPGGLTSIDALSECLSAARVEIGKMTDRWRWPASVDPAATHPGIDCGGFLPSVDEFDASFFRISSREAELLDPQQRLLLELSWEALEDAGQPPSRLAGQKVGVFIGACHADYRDLLVTKAPSDEPQIASGSAMSLLANRISYFYNLAGPSFTIDTACSSSLFAVHEAVRALRAGDCTSALVGAVNLMCSPTNTLSYYEAGMLSRRGKCRSFDRDADGYVRAEGTVVLVLKPLTHALRDGDLIHCVLLGSAVNHGGQASSLTAPRPDAQAAVIEAALMDAGITADSLGLLEAHGSGTPLGDPIEVEGLRRAFRSGAKRVGQIQKGSCALGSVKANLGHLEAAAGLAGIAKVITCMSRSFIPPAAGFENANPDLRLDDSPFYVPTTARPWTRGGDPAPGARARRAGISSFGFGGANAHVILEEPPAAGEHREREEHVQGPYVIPLSGRTTRQLDLWMRVFREYCQNAARDGVRLVDVAYTLQKHRQHLSVRRALVASTFAEVLELLEVACDQAADSQRLLVSRHIAGTSGSQATLDRARDWLGGKDDALTTANGTASAHRVRLPPTPLIRKRYWVGGRAETHDALLSFELRWGPKPLTAELSITQPTHHVLMVSEDINTIEQLQDAVRAPHVQAFHSRSREGASRYDELMWALVGAVKNVAVKSRDCPQSIQIAWLDPEDAPLAAAAAGMLRTVALEYPALRYQVISFDTKPEACDACALLKEEERSEDHEVRYTRAGRLVRERKEVPESRVELTSALRAHGVFVIAGGTGGVGRILASEIVSRVPQPILVMLNRHGSSEDLERLIEVWRSQGATVEILAVDVADASAVSAGLAAIRMRYGNINAVIHAAGQISDALLENISASDFRSVARSKVAGVINLDAATADCHLDLFVVFSSISGEFGNPGQASYAAANAFVEGYAYTRNQRVTAGSRRGRTMVVSWPQWLNGGMQVGPANAEQLAMRLGLRPMPDQAGRFAFTSALGGSADHVIVMYGDATRIREVSLTARRGNLPAADTSQVWQVRARIREQLIQAIAEHLQIPTTDVEVGARFGDMAFDSVSYTQFANKLNREHGFAILPTVFYQYPTVERLVEHLAASARLVAPTPSDSQVTSESSHRPLSAPGKPLDSSTRNAPEAIAITGMAGRFPGAKDLEQFWNNLVEGHSHVGEVPASRWDWRRYSEDSSSEAHRHAMQWGGFIEDIDEFDAGFFNISPAEARCMDPQHRLLLMYAWKAIEDAGHAPSELAGTRTGVFIAIGNSDYARVMREVGARIEGFSAVGTLSTAAPNRISHFLDLTGPSETVDTACSSSLVALHRAVAAIRAGECDQALVGAVNLMLTPDLHISLSRAGALSPDGKCHAFSAGANGYARSEGVCVFVLRRLADAQRDADPVYGIVLGSAVNHVGRSQSLTAPSARAQASLIKSAWCASGVDPASVTYFESHGTGTILGDPIEIEGIQLALSELASSSSVPPRCAIGSVKSNIGHAEVAAGAAGLAKVLLQIQNGSLIPTLHCKPLNPYIDLSSPALYVVTETQPWSRRGGSTGVPMPRRAAISSFGISGSNAHVVIEEWQRLELVSRRSSPSTMECIVLSARSEEQLLAQARQLHSWLETNAAGLRDLRSVAFTLQTGRTEFNERLAILALSVEHLRAKLSEFTCGDTRNIIRGRASANGGALSLFDSLAELTPRLTDLIAQGELKKLATLWTNGLKVDWASLYAGQTQARLHLPTYPFARERCWPVSPSSGTGRIDASLRAPAPSQETTEYRVVLTGRESFLRDHRISNQLVLPAVVYLGMALEALGRLRSEADPCRHTCLEDIRWHRPLVCNLTPRELVTVCSVPDEVSGIVDFAVEEDDSRLSAGEHIRYCTGRGLLRDEPTAIDSMDLPLIQARCQRRVFDRDTCYAAFAQSGIDYGRTHRVITLLAIGAEELLVRLEAPVLLSGEPDSNPWLHPGILDGVLQATIAFHLSASGTLEQEIGLPAALRGFDWLRRISGPAWAHIRRTRVGASGRVYDADICDDAGEVCARIRGLVTKPFQSKLAQAVRAGDAVSALFAHAQWRKVESAQQFGSFAEHIADSVVVVCNDADASRIRRLGSNRIIVGDPAWTIESWRQALHPHGSVARLVWLLPGAAGRPDAHATIAGQAEGVLSGFRLLKALLDEGYGPRALELIAITSRVLDPMNRGAVDPTHAAVHGLLTTCAREVTNWRIVVVDVPDPLRFPETWIPLARHAGRAEVLAFAEGHWFRRSIAASVIGGERYLHSPESVYVIIGGAGGIGRALTEELIRKHGTQIVWIGRRAEDETIRSARIHMRSLGPEPIYLRADAADLASLRQARELIVRQFGRIDGVIHAAMDLKDAGIATMSETRFREGLISKLDSTAVAAEVFGALPLEFFLIFSSINSLVQIPGQSNYIAGCTFQDSFAEHFAALVGFKVRVINWGYWGSVGAVADEHHRVRLEQRGFRSIEPPEALAVIDHVLAGRSVQAVFVKVADVRLVLEDAVEMPRPDPESPDARAQQPLVCPRLTGRDRAGELRSLINFVLAVAVRTLGYSREALVTPDGRSLEACSLSEFGVDSIAATNLGNELAVLTGVPWKIQHLVAEPLQRLVALMYEPLLVAQMTVVRGGGEEGRSDEGLEVIEF